ncbi:unnamed protein product [Orchesella dallaii]|uniref:phosphatidylserine decarboxylase n=1 Tax=Orchesella dallaii TaxID=48710 RepID=A0ABP1Q632_9HEXA
MYSRSTNGMKYLKWTWLPVLATGFGTAIVYTHEKDSREVQVQAKGWKITCYRTMPLRSFSRAFGWVSTVNLPVWARKPVYSTYAKVFSCALWEAEVEDLNEYKNLGEFFRRRLKPGIRPISYESSVVSPADGTLLNMGKVDIERCTVEQVKDITYSLPTFLGPPTWKRAQKFMENTQLCSSLLKKEGTSLYQCVIYLAPGDYHRFHSPVDCKIYFRRHFSGELFSVNPTIARWLAGLFALNERVVYVGEWEHGFFCFVAVGATNVGSISVYEDKDLMTNRRIMKKDTFVDKEFDPPLTFEKGDDFGEFNFGSTIIILFEAPTTDFELVPLVGSKIQYGESLFTLLPCRDCTPDYSEILLLS